ncbi:MAG: cytochrome b N-terminal domain-containing protein [Chloroflexi bacterium]|nr:cytochrome b N-terminal domain-containing protein [Chloroflexota bacterium]
MLNRFYNFLDERYRVTPLLRDIADHQVPDHANPTRDMRAFVYCLGGISFMVAILLFTTGVLLAVYYVPAPERAYDSIQYIMNGVAFGPLIRGIHHWGASLLIITMVLHMLRVFFHGAYKDPRQLNWVAGLLLLMAVMGMGFTGYLLPWDQKAYWATNVGTFMAATVPFIGDFIMRVLRGGPELGAITLIRFYALHVLVLPAIIGLLLAFHFLMIRRQGISGPL